MRPLRAIWDSEWRFSSLLVSLLILFIFAPLLGSGLWQKTILGLFFTWILISGVYAISGKRRFLIWSWILAGLVWVFQIIYLVIPSPVFILIRIALFTVFFILIGKTILGNVLRRGSMTGDRIIGAICMYLVLGLGWGLVYSGMEEIWSGSFQIPEELTVLASEGGDRFLSIFLYYSFVTLSTLGFGDITPVIPMARTLSVLEAITGQLYIAILIAGLVGVHISDRQRREQDQG